MPATCRFPSHSCRFAIMVAAVALVDRAMLCGAAQADSIQFTRTAPVPASTSFTVKAVADMNGDGLDDIVRISRSAEVSQLRQLPGGGFSVVSMPPRTGFTYAVAVADVDEDGFNDALTGGNYEEINLHRSADGGATYGMSLLSGGNTVYTQGANFADIDRDGLLDAFVCHDEGLSRIWKGQGNGLFTTGNHLINLATVPVSDNGGNYGSVWADVDNDGDPDLYIAKCKLGVTDPADPRRVNQLFINNGPAGFSEQAAARGLADGAQSWCSDFQDIDNDGDLDCFIANHGDPSRLLLNDGTGHFTDITASSGIADIPMPMQALLRDFDNDGFIDLATGSFYGATVWRNNGDLTFTLLPGVLEAGLDAVLSFASGDLNHDGRLDLYTSIFSFSGFQVPDEVCYGTPGTNHFLALTLAGTASNRSAIGARITVRAGGRIFTREVRSGEGYGISCSLTQHFGLGSSTTVEDVTVRWPSGRVTTVHPSLVDRFYFLREDGSLALDTPQAVQCSQRNARGLPVTYACWQMDHALQTLGTASDDPDRDGLENLAEYALGTSPFTPPAPQDAVPLNLSRSESGVLQLSLRRVSGLTDVQVRPEFSPDLASSWQPLPGAPSSITAHRDGTETHTWQLGSVLPHGASSRAFFRLHVAALPAV